MKRFLNAFVIFLGLIIVVSVNGGCSISPKTQIEKDRENLIGLWLEVTPNVGNFEFEKGGSFRIFDALQTQEVKGSWDISTQGRLNLKAEGNAIVNFGYSFQGDQLTIWPEQLEGESVTLKKVTKSDTSITIQSDVLKTSEDDQQEKSTDGNDVHNMSEKSKIKFMDSCKLYTYEQLARTPDKYKGYNVKLDGKVMQVIEDGTNIVQLMVHITKNAYPKVPGVRRTYYWTDVVYVVYVKAANEKRILEDDIITLWGLSDGLYTYTTVQGASNTVPKVLAKFIIGIDPNQSNGSLVGTTIDPFDVTVDEIAKAVSENVTKASNTYKSRYVKLTGLVHQGDGIPRGGDFWLTPLNGSGYEVRCKIKKEHSDTVKNFTEGQKITVSGVITYVGQILSYTIINVQSFDFIESRIETKKIQFDITVDEVVQDIKEDETSAISTYKNKYVKLTGRVCSVDGSYGSFFSLKPLSDDLVPISGDFHLRVDCLVRIDLTKMKDSGEKVLNFTGGEIVTVIGTITSVGESSSYESGTVLMVESIV